MIVTHMHPPMLPHPPCAHLHAACPHYAHVLPPAHAHLPLVSVFLFFFLSAHVHNCNPHVPTHISTPLPAPTFMHLSGHAHDLLPMLKGSALPHRVMMTATLDSIVDKMHGLLV